MLMAGELEGGIAAQPIDIPDKNGVQEEAERRLEVAAQTEGVEDARGQMTVVPLAVP
jgi:hypothetical protein